MKAPHRTHQILDQALKNKITVLSEKQAARILSEFDIPMVPNISATTPEDASRAARDLGFPVVVKGCGSNLAHKSELGLVKPGLATAAAVTAAAEALLENPPDGQEELLVQPMVPGKREFVAGMFRDTLFGAVVMFGLGGIFTEALHDVVFRLAPLCDDDIMEMVSEISSKALLDQFRGEAPVNRDQLYRTLKGISRLADTCPEVLEVDINPLIVTAHGAVTGVDALVKLGPPAKSAPTRPPVDTEQLKALFFPDAVAFVGASATIGKWGNILPCNVVSGGYKGKMYMVNPRGGTILGQPVYKRLADIDGNVDLAVVTIPAAGILDLIPQLKGKGIRGMLLITSGFSETGPKGKALEKEMVERAADAGIVILGPNTMGICSPHKKFHCTSSYTHTTPGTTALVSQSGNLGVQLLSFAEQNGIGMRLYSGSGNEAMVTVEDYLELFEKDELTRTVVLYLESVKEGRRFFDVASRLTRKKPVVMLKGGRTSAGSRAAASHTGAMASDAAVFNAACRQAGIIQVRQPMEMVDAAAAFSSLPLPRGNRVGIVTLGGGWGVVTTDMCQENGLVLPDLPADIIEKLNQMLPDYWSKANPIDVVGEYIIEIPLVSIEALLQWEGCDAVIHLGIDGKRIFGDKMIESVASSDPGFDKQEIPAMHEALLAFDRDFKAKVKDLVNRYQKPVIGVSLITDGASEMIHGDEASPYKTVLFPSPERAVRTLAYMCEYAGHRA